jgi:hypothetical protein
MGSFYFLLLYLAKRYFSWYSLISTLGITWQAFRRPIPNIENLPTKEITMRMFIGTFLLWVVLLFLVSPARAALYDLPADGQRVDAMLSSFWGQANTNGSSGSACFNYYTPPGPAGSSSNYWCGCGATALAQLMRYHQWPATGVGTKSFTNWVDGQPVQLSLRGGDGNGGPYNWSLMPLIIDSSIIEEECQAIGALTYDAGVGMGTAYTATHGSMSSAMTEPGALVNVFHYANAIHGVDPGGGAIDTATMLKMINCNLDAGYPVTLGFLAHADVCDGYGFDANGVMYHHLNIGTTDTNNACWYNILDSSGTMDYSVPMVTVYNIWPQKVRPASGSLEIISGRVTDASGNPLSEVNISALVGSNSYTATSNSRGIYALVQVPSNTAYAITATKSGYHFDPQAATTGRSVTDSAICGNVWGVNFVENPNFTQTTPALTWATPADIIFGTPLGNTQLNASASAPGTFVYSPPLGTTLMPGVHILSVSFTPTDTVSYTNATKSVAINVEYGRPFGNTGCQIGEGSGPIPFCILAVLCGLAILRRKRLT